MSTPGEIAVEQQFAQVVSYLDSGYSRQQMIDLLVESGLERESAALFVRTAHAAVMHERRVRGARMFLGGVGLALLGGLVTLGAWFWAGPGGTYIVTYGLIIVGALYALWGVFKTLISYSGIVSALKWLTAYAVVITLLVLGGAVVLNKTINAPLPDVPDDSKVKWEQHELGIPPGGLRAGGAVTISGEVTNLDDLWYIDDAVIRLTEVDRTGGTLVNSRKEIPVTPDSIAPGESGVYSLRLTPRERTTGFDTEIIWSWAMR